jgi:hypothetical protein
MIEIGKNSKNRTLNLWKIDFLKKSFLIGEKENFGEYFHLPN